MVFMGVAMPVGGGGLVFGVWGDGCDFVNW
jgi:hypothetical protein